MFPMRTPTRKIGLRLAGGWIVAAVLLAACSASAPARTVYFVPFEGFPAPILEDLANYCKSRFGLIVRARAALTLDTDAADPSRRQLIAEELITRMRRGDPALASDPRTVLIGFTSDDMYARGQANWQFVFGWRQEGRFAVISSARLEPSAIGEVPDDELLRARLRKTVTRYMGFLYYGLPLSDDRSSVLYRAILGVDDLDLIGDDFAPAPPPADPGAASVRSYRLPECRSRRSSASPSAPSGCA